MPLYEYQCKKCGSRFEQIEKFSDKPQTKCPKCKKGRVERLISSPAIQFKGTGWYVTDYASKSGAPKEESKGGAEEAVKTTEKPTEDKPKEKKKESPQKESKESNHKE